MHGYNEAGFNIKAFSEIVDDIEDNYRSRLSNPEYVLDFNTPEGIFSEALAYEISKLWEQLLLADNMKDINTASGVHLDRLGLLYGTKRIKGEHGQGKIQLVFETKPELSEIKWEDAIKLGTLNYYASNIDSISEDGKTFMVRVLTEGFTENYDIPAGKTFKGKFYGKPATITVIETIEGGLEVEPDSLFRRRIQNRKAKHGVATKQALVDALKLVEGVEDVLVLDPESSPKTDTGTIKIFISGRPSRAISEKILEIKADGILTVKDPSSESFEDIIEDEAGISRKITYNIIKKTPIKLKIKVKRMKTDKTNMEITKQIQDEAIKYINQLENTEDLYYVKLYAEVLGIDYLKEIQLLISTDGSEPAAQDFSKTFSPGTAGRFTLARENIEVEYE